jgi:DNA-binding transcriptional LysR family regulator
MDIRFLTTFVEVVKTRHFGKAAENLYLTQSAVSARIKLLEEYFHTTLFIRHRNSIQLTPAGEKLLPYAEQLCATLKEAKQELQIQAAEYLVCGAGQLINELWVPDILNGIHQRFPEWSIKAEILSLEQMSRQLHERSIDLAFTSEPLKSEELVCKLLARQPLGLYRINGKDASFDSKDFVAIDWGSKARDELLEQFSQCRDAKLRTNSLRLALSTLRKEGGVAVLPMQMDWAEWGVTQVTLISPLPKVGCSVYLNYMKNVRRVGLAEVIHKIDNLVEATV